MFGVWIIIYTHTYAYTYTHIHIHTCIVLHRIKIKVISIRSNTHIFILVHFFQKVIVRSSTSESPSVFIKENILGLYTGFMESEPLCLGLTSFPCDSFGNKV